MKFGRLTGCDGKAVVVLGAGATRGSALVQPNRPKGLPLPPLDADFFTQAQRVWKGQKQVDQLIEDVVGIFGTNFSLTMETFLTQIEHLRRAYKDYKFPGRPPANPYDAVRHNFVQVIALLLDVSLGHDPKCPYHDRLVELLCPDDVVLNLNYDCLLDNSLRLHGHGKWNATDGYGVKAYADAARDHWNGDAPAARGTQVHHLKLHGSLHWRPSDVDQRTPRIRLKQRWWGQHGEMKFDLIPPEWHKIIDKGIYQHIWRKARGAVRDAEVLAFVGYSMPPSDLPLQALLRIDATSKTAGKRARALKTVLIANPDSHSRRRIRDVLHDRITKSTRVLVFDSFEELHGFWGP